jgi:hypothetical protein
MSPRARNTDAVALTRLPAGRTPADELVPALPQTMEEATDMMEEAIGDFMRAALRQAVIVSYARDTVFRGEPGPWLSWAVDTCGMSRRYVIQLWHAGDILRKCNNVALLHCDTPKLELLAKLPQDKLQAFLAAHDPGVMTRDELRAKLAMYMYEAGPGTEDGEVEPAPRKSRRDASPVAKYFRAIEILSDTPDEERLMVAAQASPAACMAAGLASLDIAIHVLRTQHCWDVDQLRRWEPELRSAVALYDSLITDATPPAERG